MNEEFPILERQQRIHELIATHAPLRHTLCATADWMGMLFPDATVSLMSYNAGSHTLSTMPYSCFAAAHTHQLKDIPVETGEASFGTAAHSRSFVATEDIAMDSRWESYREAALAEGYQACWSYPVLAPDEELLGVVSLYYHAAQAAVPDARRRLQQAAALIALALIRDRDSQKHRTLYEWHSALFNNHSDSVYELNLQGHFQRGNSALEAISGYSESELVGVHFSELIAPGYQEQTRAAFDSACQGQTVTYETQGIHASGHIIHLEVTNFPVVIDDNIAGVWGICRDITERKQQEAQIAYQATHDILTGLPNGTAFSDQMADLFWACQRENKPIAFLYLDLDGFKSINDGLGHPTGNQLLAEVARRIQSSVQGQNIVGRLVGDEFGILLHGYRDSKQVIEVAEQILDELVRPFEVGKLALHLSGSIGIAATETELKQPHELMQHADIALNHAKRKGRNTWQWYQGGGAKSTRDSVVLRNELQKALENDEFTLHYQPLVDAASGRIRSVEALIRWNHPIRGMISPGDFIPLAEKTGQIIPLGQWVLRQACHEMARLNASGDRMLPVAVNISSLQFLRENFLSNVDDALSESGLPAEFLELEVTESVLLDGAEPVIALMESLNKRGINVAIDDFGTGFSSLSYLRDLPTHKVKLDRSFISKTLTDRRTAAIVQGVITMAHHMDMVVVAEGIEEAEEQSDLMRRGCDLLQGYRFSRPVPLDVLAELPDRLPVG